MSTAMEMWDQEREKEKALSTAVSMAEYAIVMEAATLCVALEADPRLACLRQLVEKRKALFTDYVEQIPRTTAAMKAACATPAMEASDVH